MNGLKNAVCYHPRKGFRLVLFSAYQQERSCFGWSCSLGKFVQAFSCLDCGEVLSDPDDPETEIRYVKAAAIKLLAKLVEKYGCGDDFIKCKSADEMMVCLGKVGISKKDYGDLVHVLTLYSSEYSKERTGHE